MAQAKYLVDAQNRKKAVVLSVKDYTQLVARIEELEDALDLDEAIRTGMNFKDYAEIRKESSIVEKHTANSQTWKL